MKKSLTDKDGEVRELTKADFKDMKPFKEVFPELQKLIDEGLKSGVSSLSKADLLEKARSLADKD